MVSVLQLAFEFLVGCAYLHSGLTLGLCCMFTCFSNLKTQDQHNVMKCGNQSVGTRMRCSKRKKGLMLWCYRRI